MFSSFKIKQHDFSFKKVKFRAVSLLPSHPVESFLEVTKRSYLLDAYNVDWSIKTRFSFSIYLSMLLCVWSYSNKCIDETGRYLLTSSFETLKTLLQMNSNISVTEQYICIYIYICMYMCLYIYIYIKIEFQNSIERLRFLWRVTENSKLLG